MVVGKVERLELYYLLKKSCAGIISYGFDDLNNTYCAPNKLYEYSFFNLPMLTTKQILFYKTFQNYPIGLVVDTNFNFLIEVTPKSACTIITKMFFHQQNLLTKALEYSDWVHNYREEIYYPSLPKGILEKVYNNTNIYKFFYNKIFKSILLSLI